MDPKLECLAAAFEEACEEKDCEIDDSLGRYKNVDDDEEPLDAVANEYKELYGVSSPAEWRKDLNRGSLTEIYQLFLEGGCRGFLTKEEAIWYCKLYSGRDPETIERCPGIEAVAKAREALMEGVTPGSKAWDLLERALPLIYPYEPLLAFRY